MPESEDPFAAADRQPLWQRLGWLALIWLASISVLGAVAWLIRLWLLG